MAKPISMLIFCQNIINEKFNSGIQRYSRNLIKSLMTANINLVPVIRNDKGNLEVLSMPGLETIAMFDGPPVDSWPKQIFLKNKNSLIKSATHMINPELTLSLSDNDLLGMINDVRAKGIKYISIFHDAIPAKIEMLNSVPGDKEKFIKFMEAISASDVVLSVSNSSKKDYDEIVGTYKNKDLKSISILLPHTIDPKNLPSPKVNNTKNINILCVSTFERRKNHLGLIDAFGQAKQTLSKYGYSLNLSIIASYESRDSWFMGRVYDAAAKNDVKILIGVEENILIQSYLDADFSIYPSFYEGFGFPVAESLRYNTPVICSDTSSMKELADSLNNCGIQTFNPHHPKTLRKHIINLATDPGKRNQMINEISTISLRSWDNYIKDILDQI